jgi:poly(3-hydroxybutyrate) depolymerase
MGRLLVFVTWIILKCGGASQAHAQSTTAFCDDCLLEVPSLDGPIPLVVVLHGDEEQASKWFERWRSPAIERGFGVLALQCPKKLGCDRGSWYRWNGTPRWVTAQVDAVAKYVALDRARTVLVGWSGGATFLGMHAGAWHRDFAALVIHGGGMAPRDGRCAPRAVPVYFLVGDKNLHHDATKRARAYFERCGSPVTWDLLEAGDHQTEDRELDDRKAGQILDWVTQQTQPQIAG